MHNAKNSIRAVLLTLVFANSHAAQEIMRTESQTVAPMPELDCIIEPSEIIDLGASVAGLIDSIAVDRSDKVDKGRVVAKLDSSVEQANVNLASTRAASDTAIELRKANLELGNMVQKRSEELLESAAISVQDMDEVKTDLRVAELNLKQEQENKLIAAMELKKARALLQQRSIRSPVDGIVMQRFKSVGEYVDDDPILRIAKLDPLHIEVIVPVSHLGSISPGMEADVTPLMHGSQIYRAKVERVDQVIDASSGTFGVQLSLPNPDYKIPAGLRCTIDILLPDQPISQGVASTTSREPAHD